MINTAHTLTIWPIVLILVLTTHIDFFAFITSVLMVSIYYFYIWFSLIYLYDSR